MTEYISIEAGELVKLLDLAGPARATIPLAWRTNGVAIEVVGDGSARWALIELGKIRDVKAKAKNPG